MTDTPPTWRLCAKAIAGGATGGLTAAATALLDGTITPVEWIGVALAVIAGLGIVWAVPNVGTTDDREVAARLDDGTLVAGPASPIPNGAPVSVVRDGVESSQGTTAAERSVHRSAGPARDQRGRFARDADGDGHPDALDEDRGR